MKLTFKVLATVAGIVSALGSVHAAEVAGNATNTIESFRAQREIDLQFAPIKTKSELKIYMESHKGQKEPLNKLSMAARQRFIDSLVFSPKGLASFGYADLEAELSLSEAYQVLSLFGAQQNIKALDNARIDSDADRKVANLKSVIPQLSGWKDYTCYGPGDCIVGPSHICAPDNCVAQWPY